MSRSFRRTRIAPTPSGLLHLGNAYSFALTAALAQGAGARLLLRIDDADAPRVRREYEEDIFEALRLLGITPDEGPRSTGELEAIWSQRHRRPLYQTALEQLAADGQVFACTCSRTEVLAKSPDGSYPGTCLARGLPLDAPGAAWRVKREWKGPLLLTGMDNRKSAIWLPASMQHFIVRKKDGLPSYQLTSLADDLHFEVDVIVRGEDLLPSTAAQLLLAELLEKRTFGDTRFLHHRLLTHPDGRKLSKSAGDASLMQLAKTESGRDQLSAIVAEAGAAAVRISRQ